MPNHRIGPFTFELWDGESPDQPRQQIEVFARAGVDGTGTRMTGRRGVAIEARLTAWTQSYALARILMAQYPALIGAAGQDVVFNNVNLTALLRTRFQVLDVSEEECRSAVRLIGPGIHYPSGATLTTRWRLLPIRI